MSDCAVKWIKISTSMFDDEKIRYIEQLPDADTILIIWVKLLVLAGQKNAGGEVYFNDEIPYTEEMLAAIFHRKPNQVRLALETFAKLRMIEITSDRTIVISKWGKHQNLEGLDKIKYQATERQKRFRLKQREQAFLARGAPAQQEHHLNVTDNVTASDTSRPVALPLRGEKQNKIENQSKKQEEKEPRIVPQGGTDAQKLISVADAQAWINTLFGGRQRAWSSDELQKLKKLLPILPEHRALLSWAYSLPRDSEGWAIINGERASKPKQSCLRLLEQFSSEIDKWSSVRARFAGSEEYDEARSNGWTPERLEVRSEILPNETDWPERFDELPVDVRRRFNQVITQRKAAKQMNETTITAP